jgi:nitroreductase
MIIEFLLDHAFGLAAALFVLVLIGLIVSAYRQGRAVSFYPPRIEGRPVNMVRIEGGSASVMDVIRLRKSVRHYQDKPVEEEKLARVLEAGRLAPSATNKQEWRFVVVRSPEMRAKLTEGLSHLVSFVTKAPVVIVACAEPARIPLPGFPPFHIIDVSIAVDHMTLEAVELGLGTCWIGLFKQEKLKEILGIPKSVEVIAVLPLGYPADPGAVEKKRLTMEQIVRYEHW